MANGDAIAGWGGGGDLHVVGPHTADRNTVPVKDALVLVRDALVLVFWITVIASILRSDSRGSGDSSLDRGAGTIDASRF